MNFNLACLIRHDYTHKEPINPFTTTGLIMWCYGYEKVCGRCGKRTDAEAYVPYAVDKLPILLPRTA